MNTPALEFPQKPSKGAGWRVWRGWLEAKAGLQETSSQVTLHLQDAHCLGAYCLGANYLILDMPSR